jgi:hypothetical protein
MPMERCEKMSEGKQKQNEAVVPSGDNLMTQRVCCRAGCGEVESEQGVLEMRKRCQKGVLLMLVESSE